MPHASGATIINTSDQSCSIQHQRNTPLKNKKVLNDDEWEVLTKGLSHRGGGAGSRQGQSAGLRKNGPCVRQGADGVVKVSVHCSLEMFLNIKTAAQLAQKAAVPLGIF